MEIGRSIWTGLFVFGKNVFFLLPAFTAVAAWSTAAATRVAERALDCGAWVLLERDSAQVAKVPIGELCRVVAGITTVTFINNMLSVFTRVVAVVLCCAARVTTAALGVGVQRTSEPVWRCPTTMTLDV